MQLSHNTSKANIRTQGGRLNLTGRLQQRRADSASVYLLGLFSGAATTCCAPVLAGVLVLTALSASLLEGLVIGLTYVAGMVFPLFLAATLWEKYATRNMIPLGGRLLQFSLFGQTYSFDSSKFIAAITFTLMGVVTVVLGIDGTMLPAPGAALIAVLQSQVADALVKFFSRMGDINTALVGAALLLLGAAILVRDYAKSRVRVSRTAGRLSPATCHSWDGKLSEEKLNSTKRWR
jgi:cytochrome c-type biogenesis protein